MQEKALIELTDLLHNAVSVVLEAAAEAGFREEFPLENICLQYWVPKGKTVGQLKTETRKVPSFDKFAWDYNPMGFMFSPAAQTLNQRCQDFSVDLGVDMKAFERQDWHWVVLREYFHRVGRFALDHKLARCTCSDFLDALTAKSVQSEMVYLFRGLRMGKNLYCGSGGPEIAFSSITDCDLVEFGRKPKMGMSWEAFDSPSTDDLLCRIKVTKPKREVEFGKKIDPKHIFQILNTFFFLSEGNARCRLLVGRILDPFLSKQQRVGGSGSWLKVRSAPPLMDLSSDALADFDHVLGQICAIESRKALKLLQMPLRRIRDAASRKASEDAFVDMVIALEGLLCHDSPALETTHRFRLRGAAILDDSFGSPRERLNKLSDIYSTRSNIVHGSCGTPEIENLFQELTGILKAIMIWYLENLSSRDVRELIRSLDEKMVEGDPLNRPENAE